MGITAPRNMFKLKVSDEFVLPQYSGSYEIEGNEASGQIKLLGTGTLTLAPFTYDFWAIGGGGSGGQGSIGDTYAAAGGGSGYTKTWPQTFASGAIMVEIGIGGASNAGKGNGGGPSRIYINGPDDYWSVAGGAAGGSSIIRGYGGAGGSGGAAGNYANPQSLIGGSDGSTPANNSRDGAGQGSTTRAFGQSNNVLYGGGGCGGGATAAAVNRTVNGSPGGGGGTANNNRNALPNTGSGGGGGLALAGAAYIYGGRGADGLVIVRWGGYIPANVPE